MRMRTHDSNQKRGDDGCSSGAGVEVDQDDLLILAGEEFAVGEGDGDAGADQRAADVLLRERDKIFLDLSFRATRTRNIRRSGDGYGRRWRRRLGSNAGAAMVTHMA